MADQTNDDREGTSPYLPAGTLLGRYRIVRLLDQGGMAVVYEATDERLGRVVALKVMTGHDGDQTDFRERFLRESRFAASLDHPNIIPIYEAGEDSGRLFIAMRYVRGRNLAEILHRTGPLPVNRVLSILEPIAEALDLAHQSGLVHRDVKPANILLASGRDDDHDHPYLSDFGVTKRAAALTRLTATGYVVGTMAYVAPEQIRGEPLDARTDLYAFGCVVYESLTGVPPFVRDDQAALLWAHLSQEPGRVSGHRPELAPLDAVVARALAKAPGDRYQTGQEFMAAIRTAIADMTPAAPPQNTETAYGRTTAEPRVTDRHGRTAAGIPPDPGDGNRADPSDRTAAAGVAPDESVTLIGEVAPADHWAPSSPGHHRPARRRRSTALVAAIALAVVAVAGTAIAVAVSGAPQNPGVGTAASPILDAAHRHDVSSPSPTSPGGSASPQDGSSGAQPAPSLTGSISSVAAPGSGSSTSSASTVAAEPPPTPRESVAIPSVVTQIGAGNTPGFVAVTPNGQFAYVANRDEGKVTVIDTQSNSPVAGITFDGGPPQFIAFAPDGRNAYVSVYNSDYSINRVQILDVLRSKPGSVIDVGERPFALSVLPDASEVWVPSHNTGAIDIIDPTTNTYEQLPVAKNPHWVTFTPDGRVAWIANHESNLLSAYDVRTRALLKEIPVGKSSHSVAVSPDGREVAVACFESDEVWFIDTTTFAVLRTVTVGDEPQDVAYTPDGRYLYVANVKSDSVSVIESGTSNITATVSTTSPTSIAFLPDGSRAYVTNLFAGTVTVLNTAV